MKKSQLSRFCGDCGFEHVVSEEVALANDPIGAVAAPGDDPSRNEANGSSVADQRVLILVVVAVITVAIGMGVKLLGDDGPESVSSVSVTVRSEEEAGLALDDDIGSTLSCPTDGLIIATTEGVLRTEDCVTHTVFSGKAVALAFEDHSGGVIFQLASRQGAATGGIWWIDSSGAKTLVVNPDAENSVILRNIDVLDGETIVYYTVQSCCEYVQGAGDINTTDLEALSLASSAVTVVRRVGGWEWSTWSFSYGGGVTAEISGSYDYGLWTEFSHQRVEELQCEEGPDNGGPSCPEKVAVAPDGLSVVVLILNSRGGADGLEVLHSDGTTTEVMLATNYSAHSFVDNMDFDGTRVVISSRNLVDPRAQGQIRIIDLLGNTTLIEQTGFATFVNS